MDENEKKGMDKLIELAEKQLILMQEQINLTKDLHTLTRKMSIDIGVLRDNSS